MAKTAGKKTPEAQGAQPDFETALTRLEEIVERLDDGNLPLAEALALFKEGTALAKRCRTLLSAAEVVVKEALSDVDEHDMEPQFEGDETGSAEDDGEF
ncbi:MAG: exodeoxyribonuclease VII small subunit [Candidatus Eremiobacteraeota bacterium]|nr:exodeoxyribonuclease VII small subunit [Candidatus Eremiobacteraeota bacterium]